ncbi:hypothetical protein F0562_010415 [Nyssa sinensis]|uniref:Uncharacterized protein n=1 Tax=Nyssa sinensis TaxID=561372 RepID=A0A5J5A1T7_9ASTE|nr:hypothetical protein F0562_010415 [Nyssa sinensis]
MILNCGGSATIFFPRRPPIRIVCLASNINTEQLRAQLDQLHSEAENARAKANNARLRMMRLSEAAEKLRRQAAISVQTGRESDARDLLFQKKKVMQALEKSKSRIEVLDELSAKLNEAISLKETQLIGNVALDLDLGKEDASSPVRIVSPREEVTGNLNKTEDFDPNAQTVCEDQELQVHATDIPIGNELNNLEDSLTGDIWNEGNMVSSLKEISSYKDFLEHLDQQLNRIEAELLTVLRLSTLVLEAEEKPKNWKLQETEEILEDVRRIRGRLGSIMQTKVGT